MYHCQSRETLQLSFECLHLPNKTNLVDIIYHPPLQSNTGIYPTTNINTLEQFQDTENTTMMHETIIGK